MTVFAVGCLSVLNRLSAVGKKEKKSGNQLVSLVNFDAPTVNKLNAKMSLSVAEKQLSLHTGVDCAIDVFFYMVHRGAAFRRYSLACLHLQVFPGCQTQSLVLTIQLVKTFTTCFCLSFSGRYENHM